eukprot:Amastigsp_a677489_179.p5 type:complete len:154 gc:universal Amastigsp_a677489_179:539-1000(+)
MRDTRTRSSSSRRGATSTSTTSCGSSAPSTVAWQKATAFTSSTRRKRVWSERRDATLPPSRARSRPTSFGPSVAVSRRSPRSSTRSSSSWSPMGATSRSLRGKITSETSGSRSATSSDAARRPWLLSFRERRSSARLRSRRGSSAQESERADE